MSRRCSVSLGAPMVATARTSGMRSAAASTARAAQAVAHEEPGSLVARAQEVGRRHEVVQVGREVGLREVPLALADPGEVEAEHRDPAVDQGAGDPSGGLQVLGAGEAVGEEGVGGGLGDGAFEAGGERAAVGAREPQVLSSHGGHA